MSNIKPRRTRPTGVQFAQPGIVECPVCTKQAIAANDALPKIARARDVRPRGVQRKYLVAHMKSIHNMQVVAPEAMPVQMAPRKRGLWATVKHLFLPNQR